MYIHVAGPRKGGLFVDYDNSIPSTSISERQRKTPRKPIPSPSTRWKTDKKYLALINSGKTLTKAEREYVERTLWSIGVRISMEDANSLKIGAAITGI